ncbi:dihydroxy-acid dehydratase, mitochondrial [[Candida] railenensis]|uniref:dihydroxy-acid dehydratase n=1 Tax=[Candida] railenensis TaxID=45579 RepID=A0A9P0QNS0_9ASCO|nr:dihydroxy-acid dehydratase, mitochondrial [[Candida] railenensis]
MKSAISRITANGARRFSTAPVLAEKKKLNKYSGIVTQHKSQGASQAMLYATGFTEEDMDRAQVGVGSVWWSGNPCNMHLMDFNERATESVNKAGLKAMQFNSIGVSDGITNGTEGMRYSLQSREIIADSFESMTMAQMYDANIAIPSCDKNMPGTLMAMGRHNRPSIMVYGGTILPGHPSGCGGTSGPSAPKPEDNIDIISAFQAYGQYLSKDINEEQRKDIVKNACPGAGACGGMYTANTMASAAEVMGMSLPYSSSAPAVSQEKRDELASVGDHIKNLLELDLKPRDIMTKKAFENAITYIIATGGSTNAVLHLIAIAQTVDIELTVDDFQRISDSTPLLADFRPSGKYVMADLQRYGGTPAVMKLLLAEGKIDGSQMTVTGKTIAENLENLPGLPEVQDIVRPLSNPLKPSGHLQILKGTLAPGSAVAKITGKEGTYFEGKAKVFDDEEAFIHALERGEIKKGEKTVCVIRYEGPKGGPGMPEMLKPSSAVMGYGLGKDVALLTDGRFSGGSHGFLIGHIVPEAAEGGPIALVYDGDVIIIDADNNKIDLLVSEEELAERKKSWVAPSPRYKRGTLAKYAALVSDASTGCVTDNF